MLVRNLEDYESVQTRPRQFEVGFIQAYPEAEEEFREIYLNQCILSFVPRLNELFRRRCLWNSYLRTEESCGLADSSFQLIGPKATTWVRRLRLRLIPDDDGYENGFQAIAGVIRRCLPETGGREHPDTVRVSGFMEVGKILAYCQFCGNFRLCRILRCKIFVSVKKVFQLDIETHMLASECDATIWDTLSSGLKPVLKRDIDGPIMEDRMRDVYTSPSCNRCNNTWR